MAGDWVLVHAGAGGVGLAACQIAKGKRNPNRYLYPVFAQEGSYRYPVSEE
jgi:hypothetical protein